jgi:hypothetical protein
VKKEEEEEWLTRSLLRQSPVSEWLYKFLWVTLQEHLTLPSFHFDVSFSIFYYYFIWYSIYYLFKKKKKNVNRDYFLRILNNNFLNFFMKMCKINILGIEIFHFLNKLFFKMKCLKNIRPLVCKILKKIKYIQVTES